MAGRKTAGVAAVAATASFNVGAVVSLKDSPDVQMTVTAVEGELVTATWEENGEPKSDVFAAADLVTVAAATGKPPVDPAISEAAAEAAAAAAKTVADEAAAEAAAAAAKTVADEAAAEAAAAAAKTVADEAAAEAAAAAAKTVADEAAAEAAAAAAKTVADEAAAEAALTAEAEAESSDPYPKRIKLTSTALMPLVFPDVGGFLPALGECEVTVQSPDQLARLEADVEQLLYRNGLAADSITAELISE